MIATDKAYPFLVSRNRTLDYRTIVAPDFICNSGVPSLLNRVTEGELTPAGKAITCCVIGSKAKDFTVVFRITKALKSDLGSQSAAGSEVLRDEFGREIYWVEGIVLRGVCSADDIIVTDADFEQVHQSVKRQYQQFWQQVQPPQAFAAPAIPLAMVKPGEVLEVDKLPDFIIQLPLPQENFILLFLKFVLQRLRELVPAQVPFIPLMTLTVFLILALWFLSNVSPMQQSNQAFTLKNGAVALDRSLKEYLVIATEGNEVILTDGVKTYKTQQSNLSSNGMVFEVRQKDIQLGERELLSASLGELKSGHPEAAIFLSGALKLTSSRHENQLEQYPNLVENLNMSYYPIERAISQYGNNYVSGTLSARIIEPRPQFLKLAP